MKIVVIGGTRKSGTTLLHSLFDSHSNIIIPPHDLNVFYAFYPRWTGPFVSKKKQKERLYKVTVLAWLDKYKNYHNKRDYLETKKKLNLYFEKNFCKFNFNDINQLFDFTFKLAISPYEKKNKDIVILKETSFEFHLLNLKRKIYFIKIIRDPRDILAAILSGLKNKYKKIGEDYYDIIFSTFYRYQLSERATKMLEYKKNLKIKKIKFENLATKPEVTLNEICIFLGIQFQKDLIKPTFLGKKYFGNNLDNAKFNKISSRNIGKWKSRIDSKTIKYIESLLNPEIIFNGYKISKKKIFRELGEIYAKLNDQYFFKDRYNKFKK